MVASPAANPGLVADCTLLLGVKDTLRGTATLNWSADTSIADWTGITVSSTTQRVTGLTLTRKSLNGTIPAELAGLSKLENLQLSNNALTGPIPAELGTLSELYVLYLDDNALTGAIPAELGKLAKLRFLGLYDNQLTGAIPSAFATLWKLQDLYLNNNQLTGVIPALLGDLGLRSLYVAGNSGLTGCIPVALSSVSYSDLATLSLEDCEAAPTHTLTISKGSAGVVDPSVGTHSYRSGALARVLATPGSAFRIASWGGDCADTARTEPACVLTMDANKTASVTFERAWTLTTAAGANGAIDPPAGEHRYAVGSSATVTATADEGYQVASWGGDCASTAATETTCTLTMGGDRTASVTFERVYTLTTSAGANGSVDPAAGAHSYVEGTSATVTASWNDATHSLSWGRDCAGTTASSCVLTMDADKTVTATFAALPADRCATTTAADCIRAVYRGAPTDYAQVADIPAGALLTAGSDGRYRVERGQQYTVVTAAPLPEGWTRFWLEYSPLEFGTPRPVSASQLIKPVGTTYTFTVATDEAAATLITFELKRARPFVRPRPDGKPEIGATVVTTKFLVPKLRYNILDTTGAATTPGSYAFLTVAGDATSAIENFGALPADGVELRIHPSDASGTARTAFYDTVQAGDTFDYRTTGLDCGFRFKVTSVAATTGPRAFGLDFVRRYGGWCRDFVDGPGSAADVEFVWRVPPGIPGPDGIRALLRDEPAGEGTYRLYTGSPFVLDVPAGMQLFQDGTRHIDYYRLPPPPDAPRATLGLVDADTGSWLSINPGTGLEITRSSTSPEVDALFDQILASIRRVE